MVVGCARRIAEVRAMASAGGTESAGMKPDCRILAQLIARAERGLAAVTRYFAMPKQSASMRLEP